MRLIVSNGETDLANIAGRLGVQLLTYLTERVSRDFGSNQIPAELRAKFLKQQQIAKDSLEKQLKRQQLEVCYYDVQSLIIMMFTT